MPLWAVDLEWSFTSQVLVDAPTRAEAQRIAYESEEHARGDYDAEEGFDASCIGQPLDPDDEAKLRKIGLWGSGMLGADGERIDHDEWNRARLAKIEEERVRRETPGTDENRAALEEVGQRALPVEVLDDAVRAAMTIDSSDQVPDATAAMVRRVIDGPEGKR